MDMVGFILIFLFYFNLEFMVVIYKGIVDLVVYSNSVL